MAKLFKDPLVTLCLFFSCVFTIACVGCTVRIIWFLIALDAAGEGVTRVVELLITFLILAFACCIFAMIKRAFSREDI